MICSPGSASRALEKISGPNGRDVIVLGKQGQDFPVGDFTFADRHAVEQAIACHCAVRWADESAVGRSGQYR